MPRRHETEPNFENVYEARALLDAVHSAAGEAPLTDRQQSQWDAASAYLEAVEERGREMIERVAADPRLIDGPPGLQGDRAGSSLRDTAMRHLDAAVRADEMPAEAAGRVEAMMGAQEHRSLAQRWAAAGSDPAYTRAFMKALSGPQGHLLWTPQESDAFRQVEAVRAELRGMGVGTGAAGGFQIPVIIDPAIRISSDGSISPIRELAEVRKEIGHEFRPVTSAHVTNTWTPEAQEVSDGSPTLASPVIKSFKSTSFVPFSFEYETAAYGGALGDLQRLLVDGYDQLTAQSFWDGNGTTEPQGLWTGINGSSSELAPATAETFDAAVDPYAVQNALPPRFQPGAVWMAALPTINKLSEAETANGSTRYPQVGEVESVLLRKRLHENSTMPGTDGIDPAVTAANPVLAYGNLKRAYTIVDFAGSTVELVPHLFGDANRPTGQRGLLLWARVGAGVVIDNAVRVLNVATAV